MPHSVDTTIIADKQTTRRAGGSSVTAELTKELVVAVKADGQIQSGNSIFLTTLQYRQDEVRLLRFLSLVHQDDRDSVTNSLIATAKSTNTSQFTCRFIKRDLNHVWLSWNFKYVDGYYFGVAQNVTDKITLEKELDTVKAKAFSSARFASLGKITESISEDLVQVLSQAQNEILTLGAIVAQPDSATHPHIANLENYVNKATQMLRGLQSLLKGDRPQLEKVRIKELMENALTSLNQKLTDRGAVVDLRMHDPTVITECSSIQIHQVLLNILNNALDALKDVQQPRIIIDVKSSTKSFVKIRISNNGPQIPREMRKNLFRPFVSTKDQGRGDGLGLNIAKSIMLSHRGDVELDEGQELTCFVISLPKNRR